MTDIALIKGFNVSFGLVQPPFGVGQRLVPISQALAFTGVDCVQIKEGTYTPNADYEWMWQNIPEAEAPNFIFIQTPTIVNVSVTTPGGVLLANAVPANKLFMLTLPPGIIVDNVYLEGRANNPHPMAQGIPAGYFCLMAQATF